MAASTDVQNITDTTATIIFTLDATYVSDTNVTAYVSQGGSHTFTGTVTIPAGSVAGDTVSIEATGLTPGTAAEASGAIGGDTVFPAKRFVTEAAGYSDPKIATQGQWEDLASKVKAKANASSLSTVATSGSYADLSNKPTVPTITMTTTDPGEGSALAENNYIGVYGGDPIIEDYSTVEINTGAKWINGKTIYRRAFSGTVTNTANTQVYHTLWASSPIDEIINVGGWTAYGNNGKKPIMMVDGANESSAMYVQNGTKNLTLTLLSATAVTDRAYAVWAEYTKS